MLASDMNFKPLDQWDELDFFQYSKKHRADLRKSLGEDHPPDPAILKLEEAKDRIRERYYQKLRDERAAKAQAKREAELEEDAAENYTISFKYNVKGVSK